MATTTSGAPPAAAPTTLDPEQIRAHFPALQQEVNGRRLVYLDNAATAQKPQPVLDALMGFYAEDNANVHRGIHELSRRATVAYEDARSTMAGFVGAAEAAEIVFTRGTTEAINLVASAWGGANVGRGDEIVLSVQEHHSNIVPWQLLAERAGATLRYLDIDDQGRLRSEELGDLLGDGTRIVAMSHVSNSLGTINPVAEIAAKVHEAGALLLVDGAQGAPHLDVDVQELGCDFYTLSGHKMMGPTGIGALWARRELLEEMPPYQGGGEMIRIVEKDHSTWAEVPHKFEGGTPHIAGAVGLAAAALYLEELGHEAILAHERELMEYALERVGSVDGIHVFGPEDPSERSGVVAFTLGDAHPHDIATILDSEGVAVRAGHHCAQLVMKRYGVAATARASFYVYNTREDVDRLVEALATVRSIFAP